MSHEASSQSQTPLVRPDQAPARKGLLRFAGWTYSGHLLTVWSIAASNILLGLTVLASLAAWPRRVLRWRETSVLLFPLLLYTTLLLLSIAFSIDPAHSLDEISELFALTTLPLGLLLLRKRETVRRLVTVLLWVAMALALHGIWQYFFTDYGSLDLRIRGPFSHYLTYSGVLLLADLLLLARMVVPGAWRKPWLWLAFALLQWALLLSLSRSAWIGLCVTLGLFALVKGRRRVAIPLAVLLILILLAPGSWRDRLLSTFDMQDFSNYDRLCMAAAGLEMVKERPVFGLGPEMVKERYPIYRHPTAPRQQVPHLHNTFLQLAAERGVPALIAYLWLMLAGLRVAVAGYREEGGPLGPDAALYLGAILALVGFNVAGMFEANWRDTETQRLALFLLAMPLSLRLSAANPTEDAPAKPVTTT